MLSKRASDLLFLGIILLMIGTIVAGRVYILNTVDNRIEEAQSENEQLQQNINSLENLVSDFRTDELPRMSEMHRSIPAYYDKELLRYFVLTQLEFEGISSTESRNLSITISPDPAMPEGTEFAELSSELDTYQIAINFNTSDASEISSFIDRMHSQDQLFILQGVEYQTPTGDPQPIRINLIAYYYPNEE